MSALQAAAKQSVRTKPGFAKGVYTIRCRGWSFVFQLVIPPPVSHEPSTIDGKQALLTDTNDIETAIMRVSLGDRAAFSSLYDATSAKLFGVCLRVLGDRAEAEDTLQDVFVKVWHKADRYKANGYSPMTWLITLARNTAIDRLRARKTGNVDIDDVQDLSDGSPTPEAEAIASSERQRLDDCFDELETDRSEAVRRAYLDGDSYKDLAARYDVPLNTMRTWLRRSLLTLKDCLSR